MAVIHIEEQKQYPSWTKLGVVHGNTYCWNLNEKDIFLKRLDGKWLFSEKPSSDQNQYEEQTSRHSVLEDLEWSTLVGSESMHIQAFPAFPDRPLVLKPETPLKVLPLNSAMLFVTVPCSLQFYSGERTDENFVFESTTKNWSSTWFGEPDNGALAYSLPFETSGIFSKPEDKNSHSIICPVKVFNDSSTILDVQRLLLHGEFLNIYWNQKELCSNEVKIRFKGETVVSDVDYESKPPSFIKNAKLIAPSRTVKSNNVISKSFHFIKSLASS